MKIFKVTSEVHNGSFFVSKEVFDTIITKGKKSDLGRKLGEVLELKILSRFEKNIQFERSTGHNRMMYAKDMADLTSIKRIRAFGRWTPHHTIGMTDTDINTTEEQKQINRELDAWADAGYKKMKRETAHHPKASEVLINRMARFS